MTRRPTPAPWHILEDDAPSMRIYHAGDDLEFVARVQQDRMLMHAVQDHEANARLIAAAPDLLEALGNLLAAIKLTENFPESEPFRTRLENAREEARTALAKAKGKKR